MKNIASGMKVVESLQSTAMAISFRQPLEKREKVCVHDVRVLIFHNSNNKTILENRFQYLCNLLLQTKKLRVGLKLMVTPVVD